MEIEGTSSHYAAGRLVDCQNVCGAKHGKSHHSNMSAFNITLQVIGRMVRNLISIGHEMGTGSDNMLSLRDALELSLCFDPTNFESCLLLVRVHLHLNINLLDVSIIVLFC